VFDTVIIGVDGREGGRDALALGARLVSGAGRLIAVRVFAYDPYPTRVPEFEAVQREAAETELQRELAAAGVHAEPSTVGDTSPARALHRVAERDHADLIVVGSSHHGPLGRVLIGDVATGTLHAASLPVAVAPRGFAEGGAAPSTLGVGFNGLAEAHAALEVAAELARRTGGRLKLLWVTPGALGHLADAKYEQEWVERRFDAAERELQRTTSRLDVPAAGRAAGGSVIDELRALTTTVDLLVIGSRGWGPARRLLLGSTADRLVRSAACPVLVVPRPASPAPVEDDQTPRPVADPPG
jgi:nucleotide-binding universal stress UspA family protein